MGAGVTLAAPDAAGSYITTAPGTVLVARNDGATARTLTLYATGACNWARLHDLPIEIPADAERKVIPVWADGMRFGGRVLVQYDAGFATDCVVALALMGAHQGVGTDAETPPALGGSAAAVPVVDKDTEPTYEPAASGGMTLVNDGRTQLWIDNQSGDDRTIYLHAAIPCRYGFDDDQAIAVPAGKHLISREIPVLRFGRLVSITYNDDDGLAFAAVRQEAFIG
jgi:hypothetical protein